MSTLSNVMLVFLGVLVLSFQVRADNRTHHYVASAQHNYVAHGYKADKHARHQQHRLYKKPDKYTHKKSYNKSYNKSHNKHYSQPYKKYYKKHYKHHYKKGYYPSHKKRYHAYTGRKNYVKNYRRNYGGYIPIGRRFNALPPGYVSFWLGKRRYFYVNYTYYLWDDYRRDYQVVKQPHGAKEALSLQASISSEVYAYPKKGQSKQLQQRDYYDCYLWASERSGYQPAQDNQSAHSAKNYRRAMSACLEARGYSVK